MKYLLPYHLNYDQPPPITLFHIGGKPPVSPYNESLKAQYSGVKRNDIGPHVKPHISTAAGGDYSILKRDIEILDNDIT